MHHYFMKMQILIHSQVIFLLNFNQQLIMKLVMKLMMLDIYLTLENQMEMQVVLVVYVNRELRLKDIVHIHL